MQMSERVVGSVPRSLRDPSIQLFRAEERVFEAMVEGWRTQMLAKGSEVSTIKPKLALVKRFQEYTGTYPWEWSPVDYEEFVAEPKSNGEPRAKATMRAYSGTIGEFCSYTTNPAYGWVGYCAATFDDHPAQIVFEWNSPHHTADNAVPSSRRAFSHKELQILFDYVDDAVDREHAAGSKRWSSLLRDSVAFKICYAFGLRRRELSMLEVVDFGPNPYVPDYGTFGALTVRWGKGTAGSGPRRRTVLTVPEFDWAVPLLESWLSPGRRDSFPKAEAGMALWPSERQSRVGLSTFGNAFVKVRDRAGLPKKLGLHCLRHSYVTHLLEAGYDPTFVQTQVGHQNASTTGLYTSVSADFKQKEVQRMILQRTAQLQEGRDA